MRFTPDATGAVVCVEGPAAAFRAVLGHLDPAVAAVVAHGVGRAADGDPVAILVHEDAAVELRQAWAAAQATEPSAPPAP